MKKSKSTFRWQGESDGGSDLNKFKVQIQMSFTVEAFDTGDAMAKVEALKLTETIGNHSEYDYKQTIVKKL